MSKIHSMEDVKAWAIVSKKSGHIARYDELSPEYYIFCNEADALQILKQKVHKYPWWPLSERYVVKEVFISSTPPTASPLSE